MFLLKHNYQAAYMCDKQKYNETYATEARFKRRTLHVPNLMQMRKIYCFRSFALDSAHVKFDVWNGPEVL